MLRASVAAVSPKADLLVKLVLLLLDLEKERDRFGHRGNHERHLNPPPILRDQLHHVGDDLIGGVGAAIPVSLHPSSPSLERLPLWSGR
jgi:hypothetical protein